MSLQVYVMKKLSVIILIWIILLKILGLNPVLFYIFR